MTEKQLAANRRNALKSTGPRTSPGKRRSSRNALKHGLQSNVLLLEGESPAEYHSLRNGLREQYQPQGALESECVENLAALLWRKRRLIAVESAEISEKVEFAGVDFITNRRVEAWDWSRAAIASGGLLKHSDNPIVVQEATHMLMTFRELVVNCGFREDSRLLKKLYGEDQDRGTPSGLRLVYELYATSSRLGGDEAELRKMMVAFLDAEIDRLTELQKMLRAIDQERMEYRSSAATIPAPKISDHLMRYEAHFSREINRWLNILERLQRLRKGQPNPPRLEADIS